MQNILIIKHGAFGDVILSFHAIAAIRQKYKKAHISILTTAPFKKIYEKCPQIDSVFIDQRAPFYHIKEMLHLRKFFKEHHFDFIFDLQTSDRTALYYRFLVPRNTLWSGIAKDCSHYHHRSSIESHTLERQKEQLSQAGLKEFPTTDFSWLIEKYQEKPEQKYALLVPGGSAHRPQKRWPAASYARLAQHLSAHDILPVIIGGKDEESLSADFETIETPLLNLIGKTNFFQIADLAKDAIFAIGNDTGPMHLIAVLNCPSLVLFSNDSNPDYCRPRGKKVDIIKTDSLKNLNIETVINSLKGLLQEGKSKIFLD